MSVSASYLSSQLEDPCWYEIGLGKGGGVEVEDGLILALMEGIVDCEELYK